MHILPINYTIKPPFYNKTRQDKQNKISTTLPSQLVFGGVDKRLPRFKYFNEQKKRVPTMFNEFFGSLENKLSVMPPEAMKKAYADLKFAKTIQDVQKLFSEEELFLYLDTLKTTASKRGIIGIYKSNEDKYKNGILKSGEDFTVYIVNKIFAQAITTYKEINEDLDNDLIPEVKDAFRKKYEHNEYISSEILKALGIYPPDQHFRNSMKFTQDGYADKFGLTITMAQLRRIKNLSEDEMKQEISQRAEGLERWWNDLSYEEKLELAVGVDSQDEVYKNYRKFANETRTQNRKFVESLPEFKTTEPKQKLKTGIKLNDKEVFVLWMQNNLAKYYENLSETEKTVIEIRRSKRQAQIWKDMTPEKKTEFLNKIRTGAEYQRYAMYDAWNRSFVLIGTLSEFLTEKYTKEKPEELIYGTEEFKEFQSKIMTEFWDIHRDLAADFGKKLSYSHTKIENAIKNGNFEELKKEIDAKREERKKLFEEEKAERIKNSVNVKPEKTETDISNKKAKTAEEINELKKDFRIEYARHLNKKNLLPSNYIREMTDIILESLPIESIEKYLSSSSSRDVLTDEVLRQNCSKENLKRLNRIQHALETAIAAELMAKGGETSLYGESIDSLISKLEEYELNFGQKKRNNIDKENIRQLYNYGKRDLTKSDILYIINNYFMAEHPTEEADKILIDYIDEYGRTAENLFSADISLPLSAKEAFNNKFLKLMPQEIKDVVIPLLKTRENLKQNLDIEIVRRQLAKRYDFIIPQEALNIYTREAAKVMRVMEFPGAKKELKERYGIESFKKSLSHAEDQKLGNVASILKLPKYYINDNINKLHILATEQAMADELYRVSKNNIVYQYELEDLALWYELSQFIKKDDRKGLELTNQDNNERFIIKEKPNKNNILQKYIKYMKEFNDDEELFMENGELNKEEILFCLNPNENMPERDKYTKKRINGYFVNNT